MPTPSLRSPMTPLINHFYARINLNLTLQLPLPFYLFACIHFHFRGVEKLSHFFSLFKLFSLCKQHSRKLTYGEHSNGSNSGSGSGKRKTMSKKKFENGAFALAQKTFLIIFHLLQLFDFMRPTLLAA